jgi:hypothetical protein
MWPRVPGARGLGVWCAPRGGTKRGLVKNK